MNYFTYFTTFISEIFITGEVPLFWVLIQLFHSRNACALGIRGSGSLSNLFLKNSSFLKPKHETETTLLIGQSNKWLKLIHDTRRQIISTPKFWTS